MRQEDSCILQRSPPFSPSGPRSETDTSKMALHCFPNSDLREHGTLERLTSRSSTWARTVSSSASRESGGTALDWCLRSPGRTTLKTALVLFFMKIVCYLTLLHYHLFGVGILPQSEDTEADFGDCELLLTLLLLCAVNS